MALFKQTAKRSMTEKYRTLPGVDKVLSDQRVQELIDRFSRQAVLALVRNQLGGAREAVAAGEDAPSFDLLVHNIIDQAASQWRSWPGQVINATGVIIHTNLGRAPLSQEAAFAAQGAGKGYLDLELDLATGDRSSRQGHISTLVCQVTGSQAGLVVNNNASAVMLGLAAVAAGKEVIVSRGEAVEIGGGFRIPDVLRQSGATLVEVGTTNRTYLHDYESAITENTGAILAVHASNFRLIGFTHTPEISDLVQMGTEHGVPVMHDLGSGCLLDPAQFNLSPEPLPQDSIAAGVGLAFFSGDKLLGGPQSGIIAGTQELVNLVSRHPLARAVRIDKLTLAALAATLLHYIKEEAVEKVPVWRMIAASADELEARAHAWRDSLGGGAWVVRGLSTVGGGSLPGETLASWLLSLELTGENGGAEAVARKLRQGNPPVVGRIENDQVLLDPRTVLPEEDEALLRVVSQATGRVGEGP